MNTPRSKPLNRFGQPVKRRYETPNGSYTQGLWVNDFVLKVGQIATFFPIIENGMTDVMANLMGGESPPARQIFYSIVNQNARIKVLTAMLEQSPINIDRDGTYDRLIADFKGINSSRNDYVHGIWWTHDSGRVFLASPDPDEMSWHEGREVVIQELEGVILRMNDLAWRLKELRTRRHREGAQRQASRQTPQPPPDVKTASPPQARRTIGEEPEPPPQPSDPSPQSDV